MCDHDADPSPPTFDSAHEEPSAGVSRRQVLQSAAFFGLVAVNPATSVVPLLPDPGQETPGPEPEGRSSAIPAALSSWPVPPIVSRAAWGADESLRVPDSGYSYDSVVTKIVVHHTVTPNSSADDAAVVRGIYNYHTSNGYIDIAYNFLIGRDGRIFEGRWSRNYPGGAAPVGEDALGRNVRAAHSTATNTQTIGVALIGDYRSASPTLAQLESLAVFLAWKCARWGLSPVGSGPYLDGRVFPTICGHRDVTATSCPGDAMYGLIQAMRERAAAKLRSGSYGYWTIGRQGLVAALGDLPDLGDPQRSGARFPVVGIAAVPGALGFWAVASDGGIFSYGDARFYGSTGAIRLNQPVVGMASTPTGRGYWLVASDGGIFCFGDAQFYGSTGAIRLNQPVVGMASTPTGRGYWLVASDGGIFCFGDAQFYGSTGAIRLNQPVVGMAATASGRGYWLVARDGGIFCFGDAPFYGSALVFGSSCVGIARKA